MFGGLLAGNSGDLLCLLNTFCFYVMVVLILLQGEV